MKYELNCGEEWWNDWKRKSKVLVWSSEMIQNEE